jgi:cation transport ATPase
LPLHIADFSQGKSVQVKLSVRSALVAVPLVGLVIGGCLAWLGHGDWSAIAWAASAVPVLSVLIFEITTSLRRGEVGLDIVAALSMTAALAFGEELAAAVVALMYAGGQNLESFAERRARREMTALLDRAPRSAMRHRDGALEEIGLEMIAPGDRLLVRQGDIVPVDGAVANGLAVLDQSALTGESLPVQHAAGEAGTGMARSNASTTRSTWRSANLPVARPARPSRSLILNPPRRLKKGLRD